MLGHLHALGIVGVVVLAAVQIRLHGRSPAPLGRLLVGSMAALGLAASLAILFAGAGWPHGAPRAQLLVPPLTLGSLVAFIDRTCLEPSARRIVSRTMVLLVLVGPLLLLRYTRLVGTGYPYTGAPEGTQRWTRKQAGATFHTYRYHLREAATRDSRRLAAGWLSDSPALYAIAQNDDPGARAEQVGLLRAHAARWDVRCFSYWHTWFTGLYGVERTREYGLWYPGGTMAEAADHLQWRARAPDKRL